jgi:hypothetical protein
MCQRVRSTTTSPAKRPYCLGLGWVSGQLYSLIFEVREDDEGEFYHLVTLWKATKQEQKLYEDHT